MIVSMFSQLSRQVCCDHLITVWVADGGCTAYKKGYITCVVTSWDCIAVSQ